MKISVTTDDRPRPWKDLKLSNSVRLSQDDTGALLLDVDQGKCFALNLLGLKICTALQEGRLNGIVDELSQSFEEVPLPQIRTDVQAFLDDLSARHLLE